MFLSEKGYNPETKRIKRTILSYYQGTDENGRHIEDDLNIDCCVEEYAWDCDLENNACEEDDLPVQGKYISGKIENIIGEYIGEIQGITTQDEFITKVLSLVIEKMNDLKGQNEEIEYSSILNHFYRACKAGISRKYGHIRKSAKKTASLQTFLGSVSIYQKPSSTPNTTVEELTPEIDSTANTTPIINKMVLPEIHSILKEYFAEDDHVALLNILKAQGNANKKLHFVSTGNRLADSFKQLFDAGCIVGCQKKDIALWIQDNFTFQNNGKVHEFKIRSLEDIISTSKDMCKKPIIDVKKNNTTGEYTITKS
jgi:hypothetical protein